MSQISSYLITRCANITFSQEHDGQSRGYTEVVTAYEQDGLYFGVVRLTFSNETALFEFGVEQQGYIALKRILQTRRFENIPGTQYRFFFINSWRKRLDALPEEPVNVAIRIEQGTQGKKYEFECPTSLASNLEWFQSLKNVSEAAALRKVPKP